MKKRVVFTFIAVFCLMSALTAAAEGNPTINLNGSTLTVQNVSPDETVIVAFYSDTSLTGIRLFKGKSSFETELPSLGGSFKAFYWNMNKLMPLSDLASLKTPGGEQENKMIIKIGNKDFTASFESNSTAAAFSDMLPLSLSMSELNGNEKYYYLSKTLPSEPKRVDKINSGDIMLYGNNCVVLFYKSFNTSYKYTKIGHIDDVLGLEEAVGQDDITVNFSVK